MTEIIDGIIKKGSQFWGHLRGSQRPALTMSERTVSLDRQFCEFLTRQRRPKVGI
jgi:hypothetical protein